MTIRFACVGFAVFLIAAGCAPMPTVSLQAPPGDLEVLAGEWAGEYESAALGRRGSIEFKLKADTDKAQGDVLMMPAGHEFAYQSRAYDAGEGRSTMRSPELLTIRFIRASNGTLTGMLDRYWDPDRNCFANTTFTGNVALGIVEGVFKTRFECGAGEATGTWSAKKRAAKPSAAWR
jgi:hypothetical protein